MFEEKKFIGINAMTILQDEDRIVMSAINSKRSLLDFGSVIINPELFLKTYKQNGKYEDVPILSWDDSRRIVENYSDVKRQLVELLRQGKNIYIFTGFTNKCYRYIGERDLFGNPTDKIKLFDLYSFLPVNISLEPIRGTNFELVNQEFKGYYSSVYLILEYHSIINAEKGIPFLKIKGTNKVVGTVVPHLNGKIIFLPNFQYPFVSGGKEGDVIRQCVFDAIYTLEESLNKKEIIEYPKWIDDYNILSEGDEIVNLKSLEKEKVELQNRIEKQKIRLDILKKYKGLFTSTGHQLENIVKEVLAEIGFKILPSDSRRSDVIAKYGDTDVVMEIKGLTKSAAEKNAAQLEKWASDFIDKNEKSAKPLLVVNAFRELPLEQRTEVAFPNQMLSYSKSRNHCLITTTQLLCLFIEITENPDCKDERINELLTTVGVYNRYSDYTQFIKKVK